MRTPRMTSDQWGGAKNHAEDGDLAYLTYPQTYCGCYLKLQHLRHDWWAYKALQLSLLYLFPLCSLAPSTKPILQMAS